MRTPTWGRSGASEDAWVTYTLVARLEDGREEELLSKIGVADTAHYLENEVQGWTGAGA